MSALPSLLPDYQFFLYNFVAVFTYFFKANNIYFKYGDISSDSN